MWKRMLMATAVCVLILLPTVPAQAGGALVTWEKGAYAPGEVVRGSTPFGRGCCNRGRPSDGPFYVYLWSASEGQEIPPLPPNAIRVGGIEVSGTVPRWTAHYTFTVPDVPPGEYEVFHCNDPCNAMLGDLIEPVLVVANDPEVRQWGKMRWLERRLWGTTENLQRALGRTRRTMAERIDSLEERVTTLQASLASSREPPPTEGPRTSSLLLAAVTAGALAVLHLWSRKPRARY